MSRKKTILRIENVKKNFQIQNQTVEVLQNINLDVREGQFVSLIGSSGCGKEYIIKNDHCVGKTNSRRDFH